jgi:hypothetical protein
MVSWFLMVICQTRFIYPWSVSILGIQGFLALLNNKSLATKKQRTETSDSQPKQAYLTAYRY